MRDITVSGIMFGESPASVPAKIYITINIFEYEHLVAALEHYTGHKPYFAAITGHKVKLHLPKHAAIPKQNEKYTYTCRVIQRKMPQKIATKSSECSLETYAGGGLVKTLSLSVQKMQPYVDVE